MPAASLLLAALVKLHSPCTRNRITASMLLARAAEDAALSAEERATCLELVDEIEHATQPATAQSSAVRRGISVPGRTRR